MNKPALIFAAFITVIALALLGGLVYTSNSAGAASSGQTQAADPGARPTALQDPALDPNLQQTLLEREAAYQEMIQQANARIQELQQQLAAAQAQNQVGTSNPASVAVSPEQAAQIAANFLGQGNVFSVEGLNIGGVGAYKVIFSSGESVYVSLSGEVISVPMPVAPVFGYEHEEDDDD